MTDGRVNARIGTYKNATSRRDVRVLTQLCACGRASAVVLDEGETPDEGLCQGCWSRFGLTYPDTDSEAGHNLVGQPFPELHDEECS